MAGRGPYGNSAMLNEIHTYFPALLYDSRQFTSVRDVFGYVEQQMSARFDVYSNQRRAWTQRSRGQRPRTMSMSMPVPPPRTPPLPPVATFIPLNPPAEYALDPMTRLLLASLFTPDMQRLPANFMEPIHVIATAEQIAGGSTLTAVTAPMESPCAICQEDIRVSEVIRKLNTPCNHAFHKTCIDRWLSQHIRCPVCRRDMRELTHSTEQSSTGPTAAPQSS